MPFAEPGEGDRKAHQADSDTLSFPHVLFDFSNIRQRRADRPLCRPPPTGAEWLAGTPPIPYSRSARISAASGVAALSGVIFSSSPLIRTSSSLSAAASEPFEAAPAWSRAWTNVFCPSHRVVEISRSMSPVGLCQLICWQLPIVAALLVGGNGPTGAR